MGLFGYIGRNEAKSLVEKALNEAKSKQYIADQISVEQLDRAKADVRKWRDAIDYWEDAKRPDRYEMMQLYQEIEQDDSVATHINTIVRAISGSDFELGTFSGDEFKADDEAVKLFKGEWFETLVRHIIEAEMKGFTLIEIKQPQDGLFTPDDFVLIPRELVIPERGKVRVKAQQDEPSIDYTLPVFDGSLLKIGDKTSKGLFNNLALLYIYKKNSAAYWANFQSKFGIPPVIVKTDLANTTKVNSLVSFLENMRSNSFSIVGVDDTVEVLNVTNRDAYSTFKEFIKHCDEQIAKVLEGQTMTSNDGSSRSQAEVHERTAEDWHVARLRRVENIINAQLLRIMGIEGKVFRFKEIKDIDGIIERVLKLSQAGYLVDVEYLSNLTGLPLSVAAKPTPQGAPTSIMNAIEELYKDVLK